MQKKSYLILRHYILIIVVAVVATAVGGFYTSNLTLQSDLSVLLPNSFESVKALNRIKEEVGGVGQLKTFLATITSMQIQMIWQRGKKNMRTKSQKNTSQMKTVPFW